MQFHQLRSHPHEVIWVMWVRPLGLVLWYHNFKLPGRDMRVTGARSFIPLKCFRLRKRSFLITATPALFWVNCHGCFLSFKYYHHVISIIPVLPSSHVSHDFFVRYRFVPVLVVFCKELRILLASFGGRSSFGLGPIGSKFPSSHLLATHNPQNLPSAKLI